MDDEPKLGQHGGPRRKGQHASKKIKAGTSREYILARLRRDRAFDLLNGVLENKISAYTAAVEMNYTKRAERHGIGLGHGNQERTRDWALHRLLDRPRPRLDPKAMIG
jgi:hypothetical protein